MGCFHWTTDISVGLWTLSYRGVDHGGLRANEVVAVGGAPCTPRTPGGCLDHAWGVTTSGVLHDRFIWRDVSE